jgi:DNA repair protein RecN (Recombination protein N)
MQSNPITRAELQEFSSLLLDLHGQHEHQSLFVETNHRKILDRFADIEQDVVAFSEQFSRLGELRSQLNDIESGEAERQREIDMLQFAIDEIRAADINPEEMAALETERDRLHGFEKLAEHIDAAIQLLEGSEYAVLPLVKRVRQEFQAAAKIDRTLGEDAGRTDAAYYELEDVAQALGSYREQMTYDPTRLEHVEDRIGLLRSLIRKYGDDLDAVVKYASEAESRLAGLRGSAASRTQVEREVRRLEDEVARSARSIHSRRVEAAERLQAEITRVLSDLAMPGARFVVDIETRVNDGGRLVSGPHGPDKVRFLLSANAGEAPRALSRIASGGEISRVMLAIKTVVASLDEVQTLVFDEIDTGIGGQVALSIASHLYALSLQAQVICITHLATIAVRADNHILVEKRSDASRTNVSVRVVTGKAREREIARMLAGDVEESHSVEHARALLERYQRETHGEN